MESFFSRYRNALVLLTLLLAQTLALATQLKRPDDALHPDGPKVRLLRLWVLATITPLERLAAGTGRVARGTWGNYVNLRHVRQQNADLQQQLARMRLERTAIEEDALEGRRLRTLLDFKREYAGTMVVAQVIGTSGSDASRVLTLDKGWKDGLRPDMAVITPDGIVGRLRDVFPGTSQLLLISDPTSGAGVILASTRIHAVVKGGASGRVQIMSLTPDERVKTGDKVMTSGGDRVFPRGLPVGTIETVALDPDHQPYTLITLKPAVNLARLEEVLVITSVATQEPAETPGEPAALTMPVHAADISAERLPSLRDETTGAGAAGMTRDAAKLAAEKLAAEKKAALPQRLVPKPALHPDRYTPGAALPATELTPGQVGATPVPNAAKPGAPLAVPPQLRQD